MRFIPVRFKSGVHTILLIRRKKDGGHNRADYHATKCISRNQIEYDEYVRKLMQIRSTMEDSSAYRVYASVNSRNLEKAIHHFKIEQIITDTYDHELRTRFYVDIWNRFFGVVMEPKCSAEKNFLWDIDTEEGDDLEEFNAILTEHTSILHQYQTPNGWHIITEPFNYNVLPKHIASKMKKDALMWIE
jgi:hypothetical protein